MFDRMPPEKLARAKGRAQNTNEVSALVGLANGYRNEGEGATAAERRIAENLLIEKFGRGKARRWMRQDMKKIRDSF